jgi:tripartite-type tricarboxylate transporter receptor subunit TctC
MRINADVLDILSQQDVKDKLRELELAPAGMSVADTEAFIKEEAALWGKVIRDADVRNE